MSSPGLFFAGIRALQDRPQLDNFARPISNESPAGQQNFGKHGTLNMQLGPSMLSFVLLLQDSKGCPSLFWPSASASTSRQTMSLWKTLLENCHRPQGTAVLKGKKFTSGKKTSQPVLKVITCYSHASISPVSSRERLRSDKASHGDAARMVVDSQTEDEDDDSGSDTDDDDILLKPCLAQE